ncbi:hypothetical protein NBEOAGPD_4109 [Methylobacterium gregans]|uniref:Uncharacterized protein n=1 Tax=Methylobacterium gregans TaxID=374424 RepID=A0AA37MF31_9HYPH|nr:hypothetical protein NBEOAGPD_4109 [Methylobacterium gregans]
MPAASIRATSALTASIAGVLSSPRRISTMPWTMSSSSFMPAMPSRGWWPIVTLATSRTSTGAPPDWLSTVSSMSSVDRIKPTPRTTADWLPRLIRLPPTLRLLSLSVFTTPASVSPWAVSRSRSTAISKVLVLPPQPITSITPGTARKRRRSTQSCRDLRSRVL